MRILAIRGCNLASLAGEFDVDLSGAVLGRAGLFAITGPVGAGKSTLLDAVCLALYDRTPRLGERGGPLIGSAASDEKLRLPANDVRSILRRGAASARAVVEFVGCDGRVYRSTWSVRRARGRATGRVQTQELTLHALDPEERLDDGRRQDTLALIETKVGLSFEQFRRSVLLAQGEFASFLVAKGRERAQLLERITGTEVYGRLSMAAWRRGQDEAADVLAAEERLAEIETWTDAELATAEAQRAAAESRRAAATVQRRELEAARHWHAAWSRLRAELSRARDDVAGAERVLIDRADRFATVDRLTGLGDARAWFDGLDRVRAQLAAVESERDVVDRDVDRARVRKEAADEHTQRAGVALDEAVRQRESASAALADARRADERRADQQHRVDEVLAEQAAHRAKRDEAERALTAIRTRAQDVAEHVAALERAIAGSPVRDLTAHWAVAEPRLALLATTATRCDELEDRRGRLEVEEDAVRAATVDATRIVDEARAAMEAADVAVRAADAPIDGVGVTDRRERLADDREHVERARRIARDWRERVAERDRVAEEHEAAAAAVTSCDAELATHEPQVERVRARLEGARAALDRALRTAALDEHRHALDPNEPCPLCGSAEHPWVQTDGGGGGGAGGVPGAAAASPAGTRDDVARLEHELDEVVEVVRSARTRRDTAFDVRERSGGRRSRLDDRIAGLRSELEELRSRLVERCLELPSLDAADAFGAGLDDAAAAIATEIAELSRRAAVREAAHEQLAGRRSAWLHATDAARDAERTWNELERRRDAVRVDLDAARSARQAAIDEVATLLGAVPNWRSRAEATPAELVTWCAQEVAEQQQRVARLDGTRADDRAEQRALDVATEALRAATTAADDVDRRLARERSDLEACRLAREALLDGRATDEVAQELARAERAATDELASARDALGAAERELAGLAARSTALRERQDALGAERDDLEQRVADECERVGRSAPEIRELLAIDAATVDRVRAERDACRDTLRTAEAVVDERSRRLVEHEQQPPALSSAETERLVEHVDDWIEALDRELTGWELQLAAERARRSERDEWAATHDRRRAQALPWLQLRDLIGSADGKKFRSFAQSLTFEQLLVGANARLADLAPRYRLERIPGEDLELQIVDLVMGGEVRSVHSLSGGETFLVSLGLALGLASLDGERRARVETLFIDEGFGSLDQDHLDAVLDTLDALQAGGHQIGIISHVQGLAERIGVQVRVERTAGGASRVRVARADDGSAAEDVAASAAAWASITSGATRSSREPTEADDDA